MRKVKASVPFIPDTILEAMAEELLSKAAQKGILIQLPIPVEAIAERVLDLDMDWLNLSNPNIMARLNYTEWKIQPNEALRDLFVRVPGAYHYTLAHEIFHAIEHVETVDSGQQALDIGIESPLPRQYTNSPTLSKEDVRRERQAQRFAAYLTMPKALLSAKVEGLDLCNYAVLRQVATEIGVSLQALKIRLQDLGRLYEANGRLYPSREAAHGQLPLL